MKLRPGLLVGQNVRLKRLLGQGGMGSVWVGDHVTLHTDVAVKFMSPDIAEKPEAISRFSREATAVAQIKSPHVVQIFDHGVTAQKLPFIVMELLEGEDLGARIAKRKRLELPEVVEIVAQVGKALHRAHALGIVHRDIKPDNIFLTASEDEIFVKVLDFGIAKHVDPAMDMTSTGTMVGTPYYMSPEQVMSAKAVAFHSDLWSLAVVAYHALTGKLPFIAETLGALCIAIEKAKFSPVSSLRSDLPPAVDEWFERALARNPTDRFESAKNMTDALRAVAEGKPLPQRAPAGRTISKETPTPAISADDISQDDTVSIGSATPAPSVPETLMEATITRGTPAPRILYAAIGSGAGLIFFLMIASFLFFRTRGHQHEQPQIEAIGDSTPTVGPPSNPATAPLADESPKPAASASELADAATLQADPAAKRPAERATPREHERNEPPKKPSTEKPAPKPGAPGEPDYGF